MTHENVLKTQENFYDFTSTIFFKFNNEKFTNIFLTKNGLFSSKNHVFEIVLSKYIFCVILIWYGYQLIDLGETFKNICIKTCFSALKCIKMVFVRFHVSLTPFHTKFSCFDSKMIFRALVIFFFISIEPLFSRAVKFSIQIYKIKIKNLKKVVGSSFFVRRHSRLPCSRRVSIYQGLIVVKHLYVFLLFQSSL